MTVRCVACGKFIPYAMMVAEAAGASSTSSRPVTAARSSPNGPAQHAPCARPGSPPVSSLPHDRDLVSALRVLAAGACDGNSQAVSLSALR